MSTTSTSIVPFNIFSVPRSGSNLFSCIVEKRYQCEAFSHNIQKNFSPRSSFLSRQDSALYPSLYVGIRLPISSRPLIDKVHYRSDIKFRYFNYAKSEGIINGIVLTRNPLAILLSAHNYAVKNSYKSNWEVSEKSILYFLQTKLIPQIQLVKLGFKRFDWAMLASDKYDLDCLMLDYHLNIRENISQLYSEKTTLTDSLLAQFRQYLSARNDPGLIHLRTAARHIGSPVYIYNGFPVLGYGGFNPADDISISRVAMLNHKDDMIIDKISSILLKYFDSTLLDRLRNNEQLSDEQFTHLINPTIFNYYSRTKNFLRCFS